MKLSDIVVASDDVVAREVGGELVLLDLASGTYFGLNEVGGRIWQVLAQGAVTLAEVAAQIMSEFDVGADQVEADLLALADELSERKLLTIEA